MSTGPLRWAGQGVAFVELKVHRTGKGAATYQQAKTKVLILDQHLRSCIELLETAPSSIAIWKAGSVSRKLEKTIAALQWERQEMPRIINELLSATSHSDEVEALQQRLVESEMALRASQGFEEAAKAAEVLATAKTAELTRRLRALEMERDQLQAHVARLSRSQEGVTMVLQPQVGDTHMEAAAAAKEQAEKATAQLAKAALVHARRLAETRAARDCALRDLQALREEHVALQHRYAVLQCECAAVTGQHAESPDQHAVLRQEHAVLPAGVFPAAAMPEAAATAVTGRSSGASSGSTAAATSARDGGLRSSRPEGATHGESAAGEEHQLALPHCVVVAGAVTPQPSGSGGNGGGLRTVPSAAAAGDTAGNANRQAELLDRTEVGAVGAGTAGGAESTSGGGDTGAQEASTGPAKLWTGVPCQATVVAAHRARHTYRGCDDGTEAAGLEMPPLEGSPVLAGS